MQYPVCRKCGAPMNHFRLRGYECSRNPQHQGIVWDSESPQGKAQERLDAERKQIEQSLRDEAAPSDSGFAFPLSGDPQKDAQTAANFIKHDRLIAEEMCPNGHGALRQTTPGDYVCDACPFQYHKRTIRAGDFI